jgi:uncharacterized protein with PQ loop repeat
VANQHHLLKFISKKRNRTKIDALMSVAAIAHPLMAVPQVLMVYATREVAGLSMFMWIAWLALGLVFLLYGLSHKLKPYVLMQLLWVAIDVLMITGIVLYR